MDTQTKLLNNRKSVILKQYKLNAAKDRLKKKNSKVSSIIYCNNDNDNVLITYNDGTCKKATSLNTTKNATATTIKADGTRLSSIQVNKMFPECRCAWSYDEKVYVVKPGVVFEVSGCGVEKKSGMVDTNISEISFFNLNQKSLDDFVTNLKDDYCIGGGRNNNKSICYINFWGNNISYEYEKLYILENEIPNTTNVENEELPVNTNINNYFFNSNIIKNFLNIIEGQRCTLSYNLLDPLIGKEFIWYNTKKMCYQSLFNNKLYKSLYKYSKTNNSYFDNYMRLSRTYLTQIERTWKNLKSLKSLLQSSLIMNSTTYDTGYRIRLKNSKNIRTNKVEDYNLISNPSFSNYMGGGL